MRYVLALITVLAVDGCSVDCSQLGCSPTLTVAVLDASGAGVASFRGDVTMGATKTHFVCDAATPGQQAWNLECGSGFVKVGESWTPTLPAGAFVEVASADGTKAFTGIVELGNRGRYYPNGERCDSGCETASATVTLQ